MSFQTPTEIVAHLDQFIVGQDKAKRSVAVALRNRWRRRQLPAELAEDVYPKNILLMGPTGCGKTEISRRLADLAKAPFLKVEASKFSEVGYHGRDVESMVRDLMEIGFRMVMLEKTAEVREKAKDAARERIFDALLTIEDLREEDDDPGFSGGQSTQEVQFVNDGGLWRPMVVPTQPQEGAREDAGIMGDEELRTRLDERRGKRDALASALDSGELDDMIVPVEVKDRGTPSLSVMGPQGTETMGIDATALQELWGRSPGSRMKTRKLKIRDARQLLEDEEAEGMIDAQEVAEEALRRTEQDGIIFVDEIDKIVGSSKGSGPDVSREGVQRDLLTVVEGCTVFTKHGYIRTDHILFIAAGAFHFHKPSELIPELQGRFPVRVALQPLTEGDFTKILTEPRNSLIKQYRELLATEGVTLEFDPSGLERIASVAFKANKTTQNIGARRLMTTMERLLEEISFDAPNLRGQTIRIDGEFVTKRLGDAGDDPELIQYML
ncbi:MAG: ATP-dependent protease ATPase subunit HslU [Planctomycetes bacterium]|nr:ATP-dependent protease ATPase subunit HslU [Planctomycetota bacterium]